jgi:aminoglycoside phosphotransferase (APT) family kinase protein
MSVPKLHADEFQIGTRLVTGLIAAQFPQWSRLPLRRATSVGTVHALYRLGEDMVVRLPRGMISVEEVDKEHHWLPRLAPRLPVAIPLPLGRGEPTGEYPSPWSVYRWLDGENPAPGQLADPAGLALDLVAFITALRGLDPQDAPSSGRGQRTLASLDSQVRASTEQSRGLIDTGAATSAWEAALRAPAWDGQEVWVHADLQPGNVLVQGGRLSAVIDFGSLGLGDPASDVNVAWSLLPPEARDVFRAALGVDDATWARARGLALAIALAALPYYQHSNPVFAGIARFSIGEVLSDHQQGA